GAALEVVSSFRAGPRELDRSPEPYLLAMDDLETAHLHEVDHGLVHGLAPRCADGDRLGIKPRECVDERGRSRGGGTAGSILHALDQLAVVALALGECGGGRCKNNDVDP